MKENARKMVLGKCNSEGRELAGLGVLKGEIESDQS
jgi:hypothetical protein